MIFYQCYRFFHLPRGENIGGIMGGIKGIAPGGKAGEGMLKTVGTDVGAAVVGGAVDVEGEDVAVAVDTSLGRGL